MSLTSYRAAPSRDSPLQLDFLLRDLKRDLENCWTSQKLFFAQVARSGVSVSTFLGATP